MKKVQTIDCTVLMAGSYPFPVGKKIDVRKEGQFYFASSGGQDFGLVRDMAEGGEAQGLALPDAFHGIVIENDICRRLLKLRVPAGQAQGFYSRGQ